jgi:hypothetical protein
LLLLIFLAVVMTHVMFLDFTILTNALKILTFGFYDIFILNRTKYIDTLQIIT